MMTKIGGGSLVPSWCEEIDSVDWFTNAGAFGNAPYIITSVTRNANLRVVAELAFMSSFSANRFVFGRYEEVVSNEFTIGFPDASGIASGYATSHMGWKGVVKLAIGDVVTIDFNKNIAKIGSSEYVYPTSTFDAGVPFILGDRYTFAGTYRGAIDVYNNDILVHHFIPVRLKADAKVVADVVVDGILAGDYGYYDSISQQFYGNCNPNGGKFLEYNK